MVHPAPARRSPRPGSSTTRWMRPPWPSCWGRICCPRPGSPPPRPGAAGLLRHRVSLVRMGTAGKNRVQGCWPIAASARTRSCGLVPGGPGWPASSCRPSPGDPPGLLWTAGRALATPIPRLEREIDALAKPDPRSGPHGAARRWPVDGQDVGRRARRPRPLPDRPQRCAGAGLPLRCATPTASSAMATSPSRLTLGAPDPAGGRPDANASPWSPAPPATWPAVRATTSPPPRSPAGCWPAPATSASKFGASTEEGWSRARSRLRMRRQHGR